MLHQIRACSISIEPGVPGMECRILCNGTFYWNPRKSFFYCL